MAGLMTGKRGLVMGVANDHSIAWGIAKALHAEGAALAFSYQGEAFGKRVEPLAASVNSEFLIDVDVQDDASLDACFTRLRAEWGQIDFLVHAIAYSDKKELTGRFINTSRENFKTSLSISCFSFIDVARRAAELMPEGGSLITLTYQGSTRVTPYYNVMGVAKAALESSVLYLANDLGPQGIRVNAISPGPMRTLAGAAIGIGDPRDPDSYAHAPYALPEGTWRVTGAHEADAGPEVDRVLDDVALGLQVGEDVDRRVGDGQHVVVARHVHDEAMAQPPLRAQAGVALDHLGQQLVGVQRPLHEHIDLAVARQPGGESDAAGRDAQENDARAVGTVERGLLDDLMRDARDGPAHIGGGHQFPVGARHGFAHSQPGPPSPPLWTDR